MELATIQDISSRFAFSGTLVDYKENHSGNINKTFIVTYRNQECLEKYTLQKLNTYVFKQPMQVMENILHVTEYLKEKLREKYPDDYGRRTLSVVKTLQGEAFLDTPETGCWRAFTYVDGASAYDRVEKPEDFYTAGRAFGEFQSLLADFPAHTLFETIPGFHNTPKRMKTFEQAVKEDKAGRAAQVTDEIEFILSHQNEANQIIEMLDSGRIALRVTHNDTKFNNVLIDDKTGEGICVIDLDTVMPGTALYDFGDAVRYGASTAAEDEKDLTKVGFDLHLYEQFTKGFIESTRETIGREELMLLPLGAKTITIELASRFLADYLDGDLYFKVDYPEHNLDRARTQIRLAQDMEQKMDQMKAVIEKYIGDSVVCK